jgi:hypothetical protein
LKEKVLPEGAQGKTSTLTVYAPSARGVAHTTLSRPEESNPSAKTEPSLLHRIQGSFDEARATVFDALFEPLVVVADDAAVVLVVEELDEADADELPPLALEEPLEPSSEVTRSSRSLLEAEDDAGDATEDTSLAASDIQDTLRLRRTEAPGSTAGGYEDTDSMKGLLCEMKTVTSCSWSVDPSLPKREVLTL